MNKKWFHTITLTAAVMATTAIAVPTEAAFSDVSASNSHKPAIDALAKRGVINGFEDGTYRPNSAVTRGQAAKILTKVMGMNTNDVENPNFSDVPVGHAYYKEIAALENAGVIQGFTDGTYRSGRGVTREQMARMLVNGFALTYNDTALPFSDIVVGSEAQYYVGALYENKITVGRSADVFDLSSSVTRGQFATFIQRVDEVMAKRAIKRLRAEDFNVTFIDAYIYETEEPVIALHQTTDGVIVEALKPGTSTLFIDGYREEEEYFEYAFSQKYAVNVTERDGQLAIDIVEDESISPASVLFDITDVGFVPTNVTIETISGEPLDEELYELRYYEDANLYELVMYDLGQYIVTFKNNAGLTQRAGIMSGYDGMELLMYSAYEHSQAAVPFEDIGFTPVSVEYEQFTGAMFSEHVVDWEIGTHSFNIFHTMVGDAMFGFKLYGENGEVAFIQGASYQTAGITTIEYMVVSEEEMESGIF